MVSLDDKVVQLLHGDGYFVDRCNRFAAKANAGEYFPKLVDGPHDSFSRLCTQWKVHRRTYTREILDEHLQKYHCNSSMTNMGSLIWYMKCFEESLQSLTQQLDAIIKSAESIKPNAATTIFLLVETQEIEELFSAAPVCPSYPELSAPSSSQSSSCENYSRSHYHPSLASLHREASQAD